MTLRWQESLEHPTDLEAIYKILLPEEGVGPIEIRQV